MDMRERGWAWKQQVQSHFPKEVRDLPVFRGEAAFADTCIVDVLTNGIAMVLFGDRVSSEEFERKRKVLLDAGLRVIWAFNASKGFPNGHLQWIKGGKGTSLTMEWQNGPEVFRIFPVVSDFMEREVLYVCEGDVFRRAIWGDARPDGHIGRIVFSPYYIREDELGDLPLSSFFWSRQDHWKARLSRIPVRYEMRRSGTFVAEGHEEEKICPKRGSRVEFYGQDGCVCCPYCGALGSRVRTDSKNTKCACCYPRTVREADGTGICPEIEISEL